MLNDNELNIELNNLSQDDHFGIKVVDSKLKGTIIDTNNVDESKKSQIAYFDGHETYPEVFSDFDVNIMEITTTTGTYYLVASQDDNTLLTYKVIEDE